MLKPDERESAAIRALLSDRDFQTFQGWLSKALASEDKQTRRLPEPRIGQGRSQILEETLEVIDTAAVQKR